MLSGNRNFEGRVHPQVKLNYLGSPPLVVAYAILGTVLKDITTAPLGNDADGNPVSSNPGNFTFGGFVRTFSLPLCSWQ